MRKVVVDEWMSLDGVAQAPGAPEEDMTGGFQHGGWHVRYFDEMSQKWVLQYLNEAGASCSAGAPTRASPVTGRKPLRRSSPSHNLSTESRNTWRRRRSASLLNGRTLRCSMETSPRPWAR
jgi:hypothetical protein